MKKLILLFVLLFTGMLSAQSRFIGLRGTWQTRYNEIYADRIYENSNNQGVYIEYPYLRLCYGNRNLIGRAYSDNSGIILYGYDDMTASYGELYVNNEGHTILNGSNRVSMFAAGGFSAEFSTSQIDFAKNNRLRDNVIHKFGSGNDFYSGYNATSKDWEIGYGSTIGSNKIIIIDTTDVVFDVQIDVDGLSISQNDNVVILGDDKGALDGVAVVPGPGFYIFDTQQEAALDTLWDIQYSDGSTPQKGDIILFQTADNARDIFVEHQYTDGKIMHNATSSGHVHSYTYIVAKIIYTNYSAKPWLANKW